MRTHTQHTTRTRLVAGLGAITLAITLTACNGDEEPTDPPTTEPTTEETTDEPTDDPTTEEPTLSEQDQDIADARQAYEDYVAAENAAAQAGYEDGDLNVEVVNRTVGDENQLVSETISTYREHDLIKEGDSEVVSSEAVEYTESDDGWRDIDYRVCLDHTDTEILRDGDPQGAGERVVLTVRMQRQGADEAWLVLRTEQQEGETC